MTNIVKIELTKEFKRNLQLLARKYRHIKTDLQPVIDQIQSGQVIGSQIKGIGYTVFKVRIKNNDIQRGKSSGYRLIYYLKTPVDIILVYIYSKLEQADILA